MAWPDSVESQEGKRTYPGALAVQKDTEFKSVPVKAHEDTGIPLVLLCTWDTDNMVPILAEAQDLQNKRESAMTVNSAYTAAGLLEYRGYHPTEGAADGATGWLIDKFTYDANGLETKRVTHYAATATWTARATYF